MGALHTGNYVAFRAAYNLSKLCREQLAEAILSDDTDPEDASSILLDDTRSHRMSALDEEGQDHERQFLVGNADDDLADEVRSFRSSASMDDELERRKASPGLLYNVDARMSHLDVTYGAGPSHGAVDDGTVSRRGNGSLAAKAGTIMVSPSF